MKNILLTIAIASVFTACNSKTDSDLKTNPEVVGTQAASYNNEVLAEHAGMIAADAMKEANNDALKAAATTTKSSARPNRTKSSSSSSTTKQKTYSGNSNSNNNNTNTTAQAPVAPQKKGWSKAAKGAVIGGVGGAVAGAIISKKVKGAVIGGVVGAGGGYVIGRAKDKKDGRN